MPKKYENPILEIVETDSSSIMDSKDVSVQVPDNYFD